MGVTLLFLIVSLIAGIAVGVAQKVLGIFGAIAVGIAAAVAGSRGLVGVRLLSRL